ncbi:MAG TPA: glycosyltransferase family 4 protein [Candidatus Hydrogenedentes bacterium]|nr:glycosyltransferase family 4 protein [Candidatus Hydrogenedentota bacterium]
MTGRPLHILMTDPHLRGGGQVRYVSSLAAELTRFGHRVTIGCKPDSVLVEHAKAAGCGVDNRFTFRGGLRPLCWLADIRETRRFIQQEKPDILHVNGSQDHWAAAATNRLLGRPVCLVRTRHNTYPVHDMWPNRVLNRRWTDFQIVVCDTVRQTLGEQRAFDPARMCSIHNGVDSEEFKPDASQRAEARAEFGYRDDELVCGIAARLVPAKGHEFLFRAAAWLKGEFPNLRLLVLGQGDLEQELVRLAEELGIAGIVRFAGFRGDMARSTQAFDIGVQPSIDCDTSSFSLKEQMAEEKPVVCSDYGGLTEILTDGVEGFIVPAGTVEPLAEAIRTLLANPELRRKMGAAGRQRILKDFTLEVFARRTAEAYCRALEIHGTHTAS